MRATLVLFRQCLRLTLFTRPNCSLCDDAKGVLSKVWDRRPFEYDEINVMESKQDKWKALYEFDTPVVCICLHNRARFSTNVLKVHVDTTQENNQSFETTNAARKLMHRFTEQQVESAMDETVKSTG